MISATQKRQLKSQAHHLNPIVIIGSNGLTPAVHTEIAAGLLAHELIKIRINAEDRLERKALAQKICDHSQAELIQSIGHVIVIYRKRPH